MINIHRSALTRAIGNNLTYFSNKFIELGFISSEAYENIRTKLGVGEREKGSHLLSLVTDNASTARDKKEWLQNFISAFSQERAYNDLATTMTECSSNIIYTSPTAYAAHNIIPPDPSFQSHSHMTDRPSLSSEVRSQVKSHNEPQSVHTESQASSHNLSTEMQHFIDNVKVFYKGYRVERNPKVVKLLKMPTKKYINLVCINRKNVRNHKEYDKVTEDMVCDGNVDAIRKKKWPINLNEIAADLPDTLERLLLVEGAPGVGKSTFAWEFCRRWERGEIAQQYHLVLLLRLREERISNAKSLEDLIYHPSTRSMCQGITKELENHRGDKTLIILEGFDELPDACRTASSVFLELVSGQLLPLATVMVTSRPWATHVLHEECSHRIFQHIEILGFTDQQISLYVKSVMSANEARDFEKYLKSHPQIRAGMYIPLNSAIVVTVYEESQASGCAMPTTLTELYTSLTRTILLRYLHGHPEYEKCKILRKFSDLPQTVFMNFKELCKLAYNGTVDTSDQVQLIFKNLSSDFDDLGFMDSVTELYVSLGAVSSHNFLHLTFQEFFAAVHISNMSPEEQVKHFKRHEEGRMKVVLRFLAGLNKLNCLSTEETVKNFFQIPSVSEYKGTLISHDAAVGVDLVQWLFEAQSDDVIEHVLGQKTIEFDLSSVMLPLDYYCLGYCISHSQCQWVLTLLKSAISEKRMRMIAAGARTGPGGRIVGLRILRRQYVGSNESLMRVAKCYNSLLKCYFCQQQLSVELPVSCDQITWPDLSALQQLELLISGETNQKLNTLLHHLSLESLFVAPASNITSEQCKLVHEDCVAIGDHITSTTSLKELCISSDISEEKGVEAITAALARNQSLPLERLKLECKCTFTATAVDSLAQFITNTTTLKYLSIKRCTFSAHALLVLARAIHHNSILQTKNVEEFHLTVNDDNEAKDLARLQVEYPDLMNKIGPNKTIVCSNNSISDAGAEALTQALLHHNSTLKTLDLSTNSISDARAVALAQALHHNSTLTRLFLSNNSITDAGAVALAQALHHNSTLTGLYLSNNSISDAGALALAQALHHNSTLIELDLSNNNISDAGAVALAQALHHNSTLTWLNLSGNDGIGEEGTRQLVQALTVNTSISKYNGLSLPRRCEEYAKQCPQCHTVRNRIRFYDLR